MNFQTREVFILDEKVVEQSMQLILHSGTGRSMAIEAVRNLLQDGKVEPAKQKISAAGKEIGEAHNIQTAMDLLEETARRHNKLAAVTETGILVGKSAMAKTGNQRKDWFCEALGQIAPRRMAYFMEIGHLSGKLFGTYRQSIMVLAVDLMVIQYGNAALVGFQQQSCGQGSQGHA